MMNRIHLLPAYFAFNRQIALRPLFCSNSNMASSYQETPWQASSEGDDLQVVSGSTRSSTRQEKARENSEEGPDDELVPGFEPDHIYQRESLFGIYVEDIVSALRIRLLDASNITRNDFWDVILHQKIKVTVCLLAVMGLPSTGKTSVIEKVLQEFIQLKPESKLTIDEYMGRKRNKQCLSIYELCVLGGFPHYKYAWSFATNRFGAIHSIICSLARQDPSIATATFEPTEEGPKPLIDEHVQWLMQQVSIQLGNIKDEGDKLALIQDGISLINIMDIGVNRALYDFLSIILFSCRKHFRLVCFSLDRDAPELDKIPDLPHDRYGKTNDDKIVMRQRSRLTYLLHFATLGYKKEEGTNAPHNTVMAATKEGGIDTNASEEDTLKQAKQAIQEHAKQEGVDEFLKEWKLVNLDDIDSLKRLGETLQNIIKDVEQFKVELPLRWIVLRSLVTSLNPRHAKQSKMIIVDKQSIIKEARHLKMGPKEVEDFLIAFTEFGSILYMPRFDDIKHLVIVDIYEFAQLLHKLFYPSNPEAEYAKRLLKHGIISLEDVEKVLGVHSDIVGYFMLILSSFVMIAKINSVIIDRKVIQSGVLTGPLYYLPSAKNGENYTLLEVDNDCAFLEVKSVNFPANFQACITQGIMTKNKDAVLVATDYCNVSRFQFQSQGKPNVQIDMIYEGQKSRLVIRHSIDASSFDAIVDACSKVLYAFCHCLQRTANRIRDLKHDVAIQCCADKSKCHYLYCDKDLDQCDGCFKNLFRNNFRSCWAEAATKCRELKHTCDEIAKQNSLELTFEDIVEYGVQKLATALKLGDYQVPDFSDKQKKITSILLKSEEVEKEMATKAALEKILDKYEIPHSFAPLKVEQKETSSEVVSTNSLLTRELTGETFEKERCEKLLKLTDNLEKLFLVQGKKSQKINWEKSGIRIGIEEDSLSSSETIEIATAAFVGGEFKFPKNTVLVSAVYAVTVSKCLLKPLRLDIQHCVDLTGRPGLSKYLKFAIAPMSTHSPPYQFRIIEEGEFSSNSQYGSIKRKEFCLVCILGLLGSIIATLTGIGGAGAGQVQQQDGEQQVEGVQQQQGGGERKVCEQEEQQLQIRTEILKKMKYNVLIYYEKKGIENLVTFTAAKDLDVLFQFIDQKHSNAKIGPHEKFRFGLDNEYIELKFDSPQEEPFTGWTIEPQTKPCRFYQDDVNSFGDIEYSRPSCCLVSVNGSHAVKSLHYSVPVVGVVCPVTLYISIPLRTTSPTNPSIPASSSSKATAASSTGGASTVDKVKKVINDVLVSYHALLTDLPKEALPYLADQLYAVRLINNAVKDTPSLNKFITEFKASLSFKKKLPQIQELCQKFLNSLIAAGGSYAAAAIALHEDWVEAVAKVGLDFNILS